MTITDEPETRHLAGDAETRRDCFHVVILGGGATGALMAAHLLRQSDRVAVTLVEGTYRPGRGIAYSTTDPDHLLNTRADMMTAYPDDPLHFFRWLKARPEGSGMTEQSFVSRCTYGDYLTDQLRDSAGACGDRLRHVQGICERLDDSGRGVVARLADGTTIAADLAILATGHAVPRPDPRGLTSGAWEGVDGIDPDGTVVIVGTGLSMVDQVLSLSRAGHRGQIVTVSRRGLLPRPHVPGRNPFPVDAADVPFGAPMSVVTRWARDLARRARAEGKNWRDAIDNIRPHAIALWKAAPQAERARFLRHAVAWWDVHRHRIPPRSAALIDRAVASGQLIHRRGAFLRAEAGEAGSVRAIIRPHGQDATTAIDAARIIDCRGIRNDPERHATPLVAGLLADGKARVDVLRVGLEVTGDCHLIDRDGHPSDRILAIGPVSRAAFWEITAIPDIRVQVAAVAARIAAQADAIAAQADARVAAVPEIAPKISASQAPARQA